jgi:exopolysaccharide biosynthesis polyprenyl glycosylphosphotransferase
VNFGGRGAGAVKSVIGRLGSSPAGTLNISFDLLMVMAATALSTRISGEPLRAPVFFWAFYAAVWWAIESYVVRYYDPWANRSGVEETAMVSLLVLGAAIPLALLKGVWPQIEGLPLAGYFFLLLWPLVLAPRILLFRQLDLRELPLEEVLIIGTGAMGRCTAEDLDERPRGRKKVIGHLRLRDEPEVARLRGLPVFGTSEDLEPCLRAHPVSEVYIAGNACRHGPEIQFAIRTCERFGVPFALPAHNFRLERARPLVPSAVADGYLHYVNHAPRPYQRSIKRLFDIFGSAAALLLLSPLLCVIAVLIKLTSPGSVFFKQQRVGLHGRPFHMFKFRTMVANADALKGQLLDKNEQTGPVFKIKNDARVTPVGRFLRKHSVDELPQLLNVLRGDMSMVGPRPPVPSEVAQYEGWQRRRLSVRPGLTCIWQVSGRNQIPFKEWMFLDMRYIDHWSLREDLTLILQTLPVVLTGRGAS